MNDLLSLFAHVNMNYCKGQMILIPVVLAYIVLRKKNLHIFHQHVIHVALLIASLALPMILTVDLHAFFGKESNVLNFPPVVITAAASREMSNPSHFPWYTIAGVIGLSSLFILGFQLLRQYRWERMLLRTCKRCKRIKRVTVVVSHETVIPFSTGLIRHRIYIPSRLYNDRYSLCLIWRHESIHVRNGHTVLTFFEMVHRSLFWFNPLSHILPVVGGVTREHLCDDAVIQKYSIKDYCGLLVKEAEFLHHSKGIILASPLGKQSLRKRIHYLLEDKMKHSTKKAFAMLGGAVLLAVSIFVGFGYAANVNIQEENQIKGHNDESTGQYYQKGSRSKRDVMSIVLQNLHSLRYIYNNRLKEKPDISGRITVRFGINGSGSVVTCRVDASTVADEKLESAVIGKIQEWNFPEIDKPGDTTEVVYPFVFSTK